MVAATREEPAVVERSRARSPYADWFEAYVEDRRRGRFAGVEGGVRLTERPGVPGRPARPDRTTTPRQRP